MREKTGRMCEGEGARKQTQGESVRVRVRGSKHNESVWGCKGANMYREGV